MFAVLVACGQNAISVTVRSFERPEKMAFVCLERGTLQPLPLSQCEGQTEGDINTPVLHALVTQTSRGEVGAVRLDVAEDEFKVVDTDVRIPGYTFTPVNEVPADIVVPATNSGHTYLSHASSRDVWMLPTESFLVASAVVEPEIFPLDVRPTALAISADETQLFVALPEAGAIEVIALVDGHFGTSQRITLATSTFAEPVRATLETAAVRSCPANAISTQSASFETTANHILGTGSQPVAFALDRTETLLLVADAALPLIHVLRVPDLVELEPIVTGVPVRDLVLTPRIPTAYEGDLSQTKRFLYAIDAVHENILTVDYTTRELLSVGARPNRAKDRIDFGSPVTALAVVNQGYDEAAPQLCSADSAEAENVAPDRLRGVFLAVALGDGTVRFVDVYDLDAPCRGGQGCVNPVDAQDQRVAIASHRPRLGGFVTTPVELITVPVLTSAGIPVRITTDGTTASESTPDLVALAACPEHLQKIYPEEALAPLICAATDPWAAVPQAWLASYNGVIPGSTAERGQLRVSTGEFFGEGDFCVLGALGSEDTAVVPTTEPESGYAGDQIVILSDITSEAPAYCDSILQTDSLGVRIGPAFDVVRAYQNRLVIGASTSSSPTIGIAEVAACFDEFVRYEVRSKNAYTVAGNTLGLLHRLFASTEGRCVVDTTRDARFFSRALVGQVFQNPWIAFQIGELPEGANHVSLSFEVGQVPAQLGLDLSLTSTGVLPVAITYSLVDQNIYLIDSTVLGLVQMSIDPLKLRRSFP